MEKLSLHHILWPPQGYVLQWARKRLPGGPIPRAIETDFQNFLLEDEVEVVVKAIEEDPVRHIRVWALYDLTAEFKRRLPWDLDAEEGHEADDIDFELDI